jgi:hypothetical protein
MRAFPTLLIATLALAAAAAGCDDSSGDPEEIDPGLADADPRESSAGGMNGGAGGAMDSGAGGDGPEPEPDAGGIFIPDAAPVDQPFTLNRVTPARSELAGGVEISIIGTGFNDTLEIIIGDLPCEGTTVISINRATCTVPAAMAPVVVDVRALLDVRNPETDVVERQTAFLIEAFTYFADVTLAGISPARAPVRGGIEVVAQGTGFIEGTRLLIGGVAAVDVEVRPDGTVAGTVPPGEPGPADVTVENINGRASLPGGLFYYEDLTVDAVVPPAGPVAGGGGATLRGSGLLRASRVSFGGQAAEVQGESPDRTSLDVAVPPGAGAGPVDVTVTNDNGEFTLPRGYVYYDDAADDLSVAGIVPDSGPVEGGNSVWVVGAGFGADTTVSVDGRQVACDRTDDHVMVCTMPPGVVGAVDVSVESGGSSVTVDDGYTYFVALDLIAIVPDRGAIAGGTIVSLTGSGFVDGMNFDLGGVLLQDVVIVDETRATGITPPNPPGAVDVKASTAFSRSIIQGGFTYFDPVNRFGGVWGEDIDGAVNVTVLNGAGGGPIDEAAVVLFGNGGDLQLEGLTDAQGRVTLSQPGLEGPAEITAAKEGFEATTFEDVEVENVTIYLQPNDGEGEPPPGVPGAMLSGTVTGLDRLPKPINERFVNIIVVETSHSTPYNRPRLPPPGPGGLLQEDGPFEILARPGELAIIATAGEIDRDVLKDFEDGAIDYWTMRQSLRPLSMGLRRFISASPGQEIGDLDVELDHPMDLSFPIDLDNPPLGAAPGPEFYAVLPRLNLGAEGYWELDTQAIGVNPALTMNLMPRLEGWDGDITYYLIGLAFSGTADNTPMSVSIEDTRQVEAGVVITPFVGSTFPLAPLDGQPLGLDRVVTWGVHDGFDGPIRTPSANLISVAEPGLGGPKPLWLYVTPSLVTEFVFPVLPETAGTAGLGAGINILTITPFIVDGEFDFEEFTYDDLNQFRWKSWGVTSITFTP